MYRLFAIGLSLTVLLQSMDMAISDIFLIDDLVEHARMHRENSGDDWMQFLVKHYGGAGIDHQHEEDRENQEHHRLPFQHQGACAALVFIPQPIAHVSTSMGTKPLNDKADSPISFEGFYSHLYRPSIFEPPRL